MSENRGLIPQEIIDEVSERVDIVALISRYVSLKRSGANFTGLCPFHNEKTPSFSVSPQKRIFHCFGCGAGGNAFKFLMEMEHLSFPQAVRRLAKETGVAVPEPDMSPEKKAALRQRKRLEEVNEKACRFYRSVLADGRSPVIRDYLTGRGVQGAIEERFELGACLPGWDHMTRALQRQGVSADELIQLGLSGRSAKTGNLYDRFRDRLIFPIHNAQGHVVAFGGRILEKDAAPQKYLNSPETPLYHKGSELYGLYLAKDAIRDKDRVVVVEGYMDVLACHQNGIDNAVAPLGTALTDAQIKRLLRYTYQFVTAFDGDAAGIRATLKSIERIEALGGRVRVLRFPKGQDPDEFLAAQGKAAFEALVETAPEGLSFRLQTLADQADLSRIEVQMHLLAEILPTVDHYRTPAEKDHAFRIIADFLDLSEQVVKEEYRYSHQYQRRRPSEPEEALPDELPKPVITGREWLLLAYLVDNPKNFSSMASCGDASLFDNDAKSLYQRLRAGYEKYGQVSVGALEARFSEGLANALAYLEAHIPSEKKDRHFNQLLTEQRLADLEAQYARGLQALNRCPDGDDDCTREILDQLEALLIEKKLLEDGPRRET